MAHVIVASRRLRCCRSLWSSRTNAARFRNALIEQHTFRPADVVREMEAEPGSFPTTYFTMLGLLRKYIRLLTVLFGAGCAHLSEVQGVYHQILSAKADVYEPRLGGGNALACAQSCRAGFAGLAALCAARLPA
jgi:hypothetical protein